MGGTSRDHSWGLGAPERRPGDARGGEAGVEEWKRGGCGGGGGGEGGYQKLVPKNEKFKNKVTYSKLMFSTTGLPDIKNT